MNGLRCLFLAPFVPFPPHDGGRLRVHALLSALATQHEVELLALSDRGDTDRLAIAELRHAGIRATAVEIGGRTATAAARGVLQRRSVYGSRYRSRRFTALLREHLASGVYDLVQAEYSFMGAYREDVAAATPWVLDEHNVEFRLNETLVDAERSWHYRAYGRRESRLRRTEELAACRLADHVLTVSADDAALLRAADPRLAISIVPNGVDVDAYAPASPDQGRPGRLVFVGKMDYRPNVQAVRWFCSEVLPLLRRRRADVSFEIVGSNPTPAVRELGSIDGVTVTGAVLDTRPHLRAAEVVVVPLHAGSGTRLKVLEAFAVGKAVVSTRLGAEGLEVTDDRDLLLADAPGEFVAACGRALDDAGLRARLGACGRHLVEERYAWPHVVRRLEDVYAGVVGAAA